MKKETFYFSHNYKARKETRLKRLIVKYGYEGYGIYWAIMEDLHQNNNVLPLDYECIAYHLQSNYQTVKSIINDFDLFDIQQNTFSNLK